MDWAKLDAALAGALAGSCDSDSRFVVFIHLAPGAEDAAGLEELGVEAGGDGAVRTATVSGPQIGALSDLSGIRLLRLSRRLRAAR